MSTSLSRMSLHAAPVLALALAALPAPALSQARGASATTPQITAADLRRHVGVLAADSMMGRETGTPGLLKARDYLAAEAARLGLRPAGDDGTFFDRVELLRKGYTLSASATPAGGAAVQLSTDEIVPLSGEAGVPGGAHSRGEGPLVYGGWMVDGDVPESADMTLDQLSGAVLVLRFGAAPGGGGVPRVRYNLDRLWDRSSPLAAILVVVEGAVEEYWEVGSGILRGGSLELRRNYEGMSRVGGPPVFLVRPSLAERLIGQPLATARQPRTGLGTFRYELLPTRTPVVSWNVVATLPGRDAALAREHVALGAHYDHEGVGEALDGDSIFNGADDDASGTAALLEIAERYARAPQAERPRRSLLFVWHTAEEKGLLGSESFTDAPTVPRESIVSMLNVDMLARNAADSMHLVGSRRLSTRLGSLVEEVNARQERPFRFDYSWDVPGHPEQIYCRSDHYNYARYGIPVAFFTSGLHPEYHKPSDEAETLDYDKLLRGTRLIGDVALAIGNLDARPPVDLPVPRLGTPCT